jgi:hypothetical protein
MYRVGIALLRVFLPTLTWAKTFHCNAGDVSCLIASITQANANGKENTILLESGVDTLTVVDNTTEGTNGLPSITSPLTLKGKGAVNTIIERDSGGPGFRIFYVAAEGALKLQGMTVRGGQVVVSSQGSGILNDGVLIITDSIISEHMLLGGTGLGAGIASHNILTIDRSIITSNITPGICGGIAASGIMNITKSTISSNGAEFGGALCTVGQASIAESAIIGNGGLGEGIFNGGTLTITNTTIAFNAAEFRTIRSTHSLTILNSTIVENRGGIVTESPSGGNSVVTLQNTFLRTISPLTVALAVVEALLPRSAITSSTTLHPARLLCSLPIS